MYVLLIIIILLIIYYGNRQCYCGTEKYATVAVDNTTPTAFAMRTLRTIGAKPKKIHKLSATPTRKTTTIRPVTYYRQNF